MITKYKRRRLWVEPPLQIRLMVRMTLYLVACSLFLFHVAFLYQVIANVPEVLARGVVAFYIEFITRQQPMLVALIAVLPILIYDMFKFSHRIAGPLYRFRMTMEGMVAGKPTKPVKFRQRDLLHDWLPAFNALIQKWNETHDVNGVQLSNKELSLERPPEQKEPGEPVASGAAS